MGDYRTGLPTTTVRNDLLRDCLAWIGAHYDGGCPTTAWHHAVRETLGIPYDGPIRPDLFTRCVYDYVRQGFEEILALGLHFHDDLDVTGEGRTAVETWQLFMETLHQPLLTDEERRYVHVEAMVVGLEHWVSYTPGGLQDATKSLQLLMSEAL